MLRVPGSRKNLQMIRAEGGDVRMVYSPLDALAVAEANPQREVVFFAIGFETTAPTAAMAAWQARRRGIRNFSLLVSQVRVPPAIEALMETPDNRIQGFLAAGHVCTIMGIDEYLPLAARYRIPLIVTGFEPLDLMQGIHRCLVQLETGRHEVENQYARSVRPEGNPAARKMLGEVFHVVDREWRGLGVIPASGLALADAYADLDAENRFPIGDLPATDDHGCMSGHILRGVAKPHECPAFGTRCTPEHPLGATMVSGEGACAAYFRYRGLTPKALA
jgi:hydrogenase expression/formation protein HypD